MKLIAVAVLSAVTLCGQRNGTQIVWPWMPEDGGTSNFQLSAAATWAAVGFVATGARQLSTVEVYVGSTTGTLGTGDLRACLTADSSGKPGSDIECKDSTVTPATGWNSIGGWTATATTTTGTPYWIVFKNMNGTPASNNMTVQRRSTSGSAFNAGVGAVSASISQQMTGQSTDSGTNWTRVGGIHGHLITWTDATTEGFPVDGGGTTAQIYSTREAGNYFRTGNYALKVTGVTGSLNKAGTPTGSLRYRIYEGATTTRTLIATTGTAVSAGTGLHFSTLWFTSPVILKANTWYAVAASETTQSDGSGNRYQFTTYRVKSGSGTLLTPGIATDPQTTTYNGTSWSNTSNEWTMIALVLDGRMPFITPSGGFVVRQ